MQEGMGGAIGAVRSVWQAAQKFELPVTAR
jgi:hypothetical protein